MKIIRRLENIFILALILLLFSTANLFSQNSPQNRGFGETWVATDALGRTLPTYNQTGLPRANKFVGIFYWLWHGHTINFDASKLVSGVYLYRIETNVFLKLI